MDAVSSELTIRYEIAKMNNALIRKLMDAAVDTTGELSHTLSEAVAAIQALMFEAKLDAETIRRKDEELHELKLSRATACGGCS